MQRTVGPFSRTVVVPLKVGSEGGPSAKQARGPGWRRTTRGFFVPSSTPRTPEQRAAEAAVVVPACGGLTGWAALRWMGGRWFEGTARGGRDESDVAIAVPGSVLRAQPGITVHKERLQSSDLLKHDGLRLATAAQAAVFEMRHAPSLVEAVVAADMAAFSDLVSLAEAHRQVDLRPGLVGHSRVREALALAHENSWSPMETRLRLVWQLTAGLPPVLVNAPVFDLHRRHIGTPDLLDVDAGLAIEYDGTDFHGGARRLGDHRREDALREAGLAYLCVLGGEFGNRRQLADRLRRARGRAAAEEPLRRWTIEAPPGWDLLDTVAERRASRRRSRP